ncbi:MAG: DegT/DnrJ/EryC1/StrS family aminotransferase [Lyngbya sp. HA4199-MV5]|jgi:dTDP-4-amino-4,6-dideoxygalactose transaminase|nr:DegT/DnrJ/EryC1/StrS family aminotransferase [Lyngbya sp. HA4199-MV5]
MTKDKQTMIMQTNPKASYLASKAEIDAAIQRVLESGYYVLGQEVEAFEQAFAAYIGVKHGIGVANGTDALEIGLRACRIGPGDVVITVSHTAVATVAAIELVGAVPLMVDIDPSSYTMDVNCLEAAIAWVHNNPSMGTLKAIIPVHIYGHPANMPAIMALADRHGLYVIEDCAQAHGAVLNDRKVGTWGHLAAFSLYPTKNLGALGDAGIVVTDDPTLAEAMSIQRQYGWRQRYISDVAGMNSRLDPLQAAILQVKLQRLDWENAQRQWVAAEYNRQLSGLPLALPQLSGNIVHVYHQYVIRVNERDRLQQFLSEQQIGTGIHYPVPVHQQPAYRSRLPKDYSSLPITEQLSQEILSLPMHPYLMPEEVQRVVEQVKDWCQKTLTVSALSDFRVGAVAQS